MNDKVVISVIASFIGFYAYVPYFKSILQGKTRPHVISWLIWFVMSMTVAVAQFVEGGGYGAYVTGTTALLCLFVFILALRQGDKNIMRSDIIALLLSLVSIASWYFSNEPLNAILFSCLITLLGFYPTFRKSWHKPNEEKLWSFILMSLRYFLSIFALENLNFTTAVFPVFDGVISAIFVILILWRRKQISQSDNSYANR